MHMVVDPRMKLYEPPSEGVPPFPKVEKGEPTFSDVDNTGEWHGFTCTAKMEKVKYKQHCLPIGAASVAPDGHGEREVNGWMDGSSSTGAGLMTNDHDSAQLNRTCSRQG
jgi:hypothetical protein